MEYLQNNLNVIASRWHALHNVLHENAHTDAIAWSQHTPDKTLIISGVQLTSAYDRQAEAGLQVSLIPEEASEATVYGFALGDIQRALLKRASLKTLRVVVMNPEILHASCQALDHTDWLTDSRVELLLGWEEKGVAFPFVVAPSCLRLSCDKAARLKDFLLLELAKPFQEMHFKSMESILDGRIQENLSFVETDDDVGTLFTQKIDRTVAVVAGGPTAAQQFEWLKEHREECFVIAVSTALLPMMNAEIVPDIVVVIDSKETIIGHFKGVNTDLLGDIPLVYLPTVHRDVLNFWPGPRFTTYIQRPRFERLAKKIKKKVLFCAGTVTHVAVDLGVKLGAKEMMFVGADFCFPSKKSHLTGAAQPLNVAGRAQSAQPFVINGLGERSPSETKMIGYLRDLETYIKHHPEVTFLNTGKEGAEIDGAQWFEG